jgi:cation:H+ antiporter
MLEFALWAAILILGLAVLVKSADFLIRSAEVIGLSFGFSPFIIGVTVVGLGTSLPELAAGIYSVLAGASEIAVATAVGSNVTNILLVLSVAAIMRCSPSTAQSDASKGFSVWADSRSI